MMFLFFLYDFGSEWELIATSRSVWAGYGSFGYGPEGEVPNHSVLSKVRARWGVKAFKTFFEPILWQYVESGLVEGKKRLVDSSLVQADASNNSVADTENLKSYLNQSFKRLEDRLMK